jgi:peptide/nickel transport system ATP-binding protein
MANPILIVNELGVMARRKGSVRKLLDGVSLQVGEGEIAGLVGESGSGKSMLGHAIGGLLPHGCEAHAGEIRWRGQNLMGASEAMLSSLRGSQMAYVFQEPMTALNPTLRVGRQLVDVIRRHAQPDAAAAKALALGLLAFVAVALAVLGQGSLLQYPPALAGGLILLIEAGLTLSIGLTLAGLYLAGTEVQQ